MYIPAFLALFSIWLVHCDDIQPRHVHLAYGDNPYDIVVTWSTTLNTRESIVKYRINKEHVQQASGKSVSFVNTEKNEQRNQYIHSVILKRLKPGEKYNYICGSPLSWSKNFWFVVPSGNKTRLAIFGDMGHVNPLSLPYLTKEVRLQMYDAILHLGDIAYDLYMENGRVADKFMNLIEPVAAYVPYMVCPGNHEERKNFSHYKNLFKMPGNSEGLWYSFNLGPAHFISISTEVYYFMNTGLDFIINQYDWLIQDLKEATSPKNRSVRPWIIIYGHRPMYCSNFNDDDCAHQFTSTRVGITSLYRFGLEKLLNDYGVDLVIWAHVHSYERSWPVYDYKVYNGSYEEPYHNPRAPVHINAGSGGSRFSRAKFHVVVPKWSAYRNIYYGYMRMQVFNRTHLYTEQISIDGEYGVVDSMWLIKDKHAPYNLKRQYSADASKKALMLGTFFIICVIAYFVKKRFCSRRRMFITL